jgi:Eukaryotic glutathione synthase, ATP binding domain
MEWMEATEGRRARSSTHLLRQELEKPSLSIEMKPLHLGLFRSDYLLHSSSNEPLSIKQVEFNTISVSFGSLSQRTAELHRSVAALTSDLCFCLSF